jgi:hypothetical protein
MRGTVNEPAWAISARLTSSDVMRLTAHLPIAQRERARARRLREVVA